VNEKARRALTLVVFALIAVAAFYGARYWQSARGAHARVQGPTDCDLRAGPCQQSLAGGSVTFSIEPGDVPLMKPLVLAVVTQGLVAAGVVVEIRGLNMEMGLNRTVLTRGGDGDWRGETILPICSQRRMEWEAAVQLEAGAGRYEVPFPFHTTRP